MNHVKINSAVAILFFLFITACKKIPDAPSLGSFDISVNKTTFNIGDSIVFTINNRADNILFYSGKPGYNYQFKNRTFQAGHDTLQFQVALINARPDTVKYKNDKVSNVGDTLLVKICKYIPSFDSTGIRKANWIDITSRCNLPTISSKYKSGSFVYSGKIDISDFLDPDSAVYIAFQSITQQHAKAPQRQWQIQNLTLMNTLDDGTKTPLFFPAYTTPPNIALDTLPNFNNTGWFQVNMFRNRDISHITIDSVTYPYVYPYTTTWNIGDYGYSFYSSNYVQTGLSTYAVVNSSYITVRSGYPLTLTPYVGPGNTTNILPMEAWLITTPVKLGTVRHDFPYAYVKEGTNTLSRGTQLFPSTGGFLSYSMLVDSTFVSGKTYDMAFVAQNTNINQKNEVVKHISVKIN